jgi:hypothetical protein
MACESVERAEDRGDGRNSEAVYEEAVRSNTSFSGCDALLQRFGLMRTQTPTVMSDLTTPARHGI